MNTQFKKGVLELLVLLIISEKDMYGYELVEKISKIIEVNEGTIYPILKRLTIENFCSSYLKESNEGPPRKYYHITTEGINYKNSLLSEWIKFNKSVTAYIERGEINE